MLHMTHVHVCIYETGMLPYDDMYLNVVLRVKQFVSIVVNKLCYYHDRMTVTQEITHPSLT